MLHVEFMPSIKLSANSKVSSWERETYRCYNLIFSQRNEYISLGERAVSMCVVCT